MRDHWPEPFQNAQQALSPVLTTFGLTLYEEHYHARAFGGAVAVYGRRGLALRLIWDGKERALSIDYTTHDNPYGMWRDVEAAPDGGVPPFNTDVSEARVEQLVQVVTEFLGSRAEW
ncbi:MAG: hypothetical protein ACO1SX_04585 [Actinomycetota bacterium]